MATNTDRIEKKVLLRAPLARVWRAISDAEQFGSWFGMKFDTAFVAGQRITGRITPTTVDAEVAKEQKPYEGMVFDFVVERIEPMSLLSFRWHPYAVDSKKDYSAEPMTLVEFALEEKPDGTLLTIVESGFDEIPLERRATAFAANEGGWQAQTELIAKFLAHAS